MKGYFKSKLSKEKVSKFFDKEGFYIVLFLCVCIVAITAVWVSKTGVKNGQNQNLGGVKDNKTAVTTPSKEASIPAPSVSEKPKAPVAEVTKDIKSEEKVAQIDKKETVSTSNNAAAVSTSIKFDSPIKDGLVNENIQRDYSPSDLVYFETLSEWRTHLGLDVKAVEGTEVVSALGGKVVEVKNDNDYEGGMGWTVVVDHGNGYKSVYANLDELVDVKKDQSIKKGQKIGAVGRSSIAEGYGTKEQAPISHLHFEVLKKGVKSYESVDPKKYLTMQK